MREVGFEPTCFLKNSFTNCHLQPLSHSLTNNKNKMKNTEKTETSTFDLLRTLKLVNTKKFLQKYNNQTNNLLSICIINTIQRSNVEYSEILKILNENKIVLIPIKNTFINFFTKNLASTTAKKTISITNCYGFFFAIPNIENLKKITKISSEKNFFITGITINSKIVLDLIRLDNLEYYKELLEKDDNKIHTISLRYLKTILIANTLI